MNANEFITSKYGKEVTNENHICFYISKKEVIDFLNEYAKLKCKEQRHLWQVEFNKRSYFDDENNCYIHCDDILNANEPNLE